MTNKKNPKDMTLDELIEHRRDYQMTPEEIEEQCLAIAAAEARHSGDKTATSETVKMAVETFRNKENKGE